MIKKKQLEPLQKKGKILLYKTITTIFNSSFLEFLFLGKLFDDF